MLGGNILDQLHDDDGLADTGAAKQSDLAALLVRLEQINDLDAGFEHLQFGGLVFQRRGGTMNRVAFLRLDRTFLVDGLTENVQDAAKRARAYRDGDRLAQIFGLHAAHESLGRLHRDRSDAAFAEVLLHFADDVDWIGNVETLARYTHGIKDFREVPFTELHVDGGAGDFDNFAYCRHLFSW